LLPKPIVDPQQHPVGAIGAIHDAVSQHPGRIWIIATGALTNIGLLFAVYPHLAEQIAGLSIMGGAIGGLFTHAPMGKHVDRIPLKKTLHHDIPDGLHHHDANVSSNDIAKSLKEVGVFEGDVDVEDPRLHRIIEEARTSFGNWSPFAEFNVRQMNDSLLSMLIDSRYMYDPVSR
jgi:hypothetical protein